MTTKSEIEKIVSNGESLHEANLRGAYLSRADLHEADLSEADLSEANLRGANLRGANLSEADLRGANLRGANLSGVDIPIVSNIDSKISAIVARGPEALKMDTWHTCSTTHCRAGWAIHLAGEAGYTLEKQIGGCAAGALIYAVSRPAKPVPDFYASNPDALASISNDALEEE